MRILWLSYYYLPHVGGGTWPSYYMSKALASKGHEVQLIVPNVKFALSISNHKSQEIQAKNPSKVYRTPRVTLPKELGPFLSAFFMLLSGLRLRKKFDVIICQFHPHHFVILSAVLLGRILKIPVVARACDIFRDMGLRNNDFVNMFVKAMNSFNEFFIKFTDAFIVVGSDSKKILLSRIKNRSLASKVHVSYNGFDASKFQNLQSKDDVRRSLGIAPNAKVILFVGRFSGREYGIDVLLESFSIILKQVHNALFLLVGDTLSPTLQSKLHMLGIHNNTIIYGPTTQEDVVKFIVASDVCIGPLMPTQTIPLKVLEYMACGKPVVTGVGSVQTDLDPKANLILVKPEPTCVSEAILRVLSNEEYAMSIGSKGKEFISRFSWEKLSEDLERKLIEVVQKKKGI